MLADAEKQQQEKQLAALKQKKEDYLATFSTDAGKRVLKDLEHVCFINRSTFPKSADALSLALHEGMRFVAVHIKNMMDFDLTTINKLVQKGE